MSETPTSRSAHASFRGYLYQVYQAALTWLKLGEGELLRFEGDEDIDRLLLGESEHCQVKDYTGPVTFRSEAVQRSILGFLHLFLQPDGNTRRFIFLTTARRGSQQTNDALPVDVLEAWSDASRLEHVTRALRALAKKGAGKTETFRLTDEQLRTLDDCGRWESFIVAVDWRFKEPAGPEVLNAMRDQLVGLRPDLEPLTHILANRVISHVLECSTKAGAEERTVDRTKLQAVLAEPLDQIRRWWLDSPQARWLRDLWALRPENVPLPPNPSPANLLQARHGVVPFYESGRKIELDDLQEWCESEIPIAVRRITAVGGTGKTRLLMEHASRMEGAGWFTGFLRLSTSESQLKSLLSSPLPLLVVVDYAETRAELVERLLLTALESHRDKVRVVLLSRADFDWWEELGKGQEQYELRAVVASAGDPIPLVALAPKPQTRAEVFAEAVEAFAKNCGKGFPSEGIARAALARLRESEFQHALFLHMAALALVEGYWSPESPINPEALLDAIIEHELKFVVEPLEKHGVGVAHRKHFRQAMGQVAGAVVLLGEATRERLEALVRRFWVTTTQAAQRVSTRFRHVYPIEGGGVACVQPDLLGEHMVASYISPQVLIEILDGMEELQAESALTVLTRLAKRTENNLLLHALESRTAELAPVACRLTTQLGDPLGPQLASVLKRGRRLDIAKTLEGLLQGHDVLRSVSLREVTLCVDQLLLEGLREAREDSDVVRRAELLRNLSESLRRVGRHEEAVEASREAVSYFRKLAEARADEFLPDFATSLNYLSAHLSELGRREEAFQVIEAAVAIRRKLAEARPDTFLPDLAFSLMGLSNRLYDLGRREEAVEISQETVAHFRRLTESSPEVFLPDLGMSLNNLSVHLGGLGRREEALEASQTAVATHRKLVERSPDSFLPEFGQFLSNLSVCLGDVGRFEEAIDVCREAVEYHRKLSDARPRTFVPDLAASLVNLGNSLRQAGRRDESLVPAREAVKHYRRLAGVRPSTFLPILAGSLTSVSTCLWELGRNEEAFEASGESISLFRQLAEETPDKFLPDLASALHEFSNQLSGLGRLEEALQAAEATVAIRRKLAEARPNAFLPKLALSLNNLSNRLGRVGRRNEALDVCEEAVFYYRKLAMEEPSAFIFRLAMSLNNLGNRLRELGRHDEALEASEQAVVHYRKLAEADQDAHLPNLANALNSLSNCLVELGRWEEALEASEQAVVSYRNLIEFDQDVHLPNLAVSLNSLSTCLCELGRRNEALEVCREAVVTLLPSAEALPQAFGPWILIVARNWLGQLQACDREPESSILARLAPIIGLE